MLVLLVLVVALQLLATPIARSYTNRALEHLQSFEGTVGDVHATVFPPTYSLSDLSLSERTKSGAPAKGEPLLRMTHMELRIAWRKLLHGHLVANVVVDSPRLHVVTRASHPAPGESPQSREDMLSKLEQELELQSPLSVNELVVHRGAVTVIETSGQPPPKLELTSLELTITNLESRASNAEGLPTVFEGHGIMQHSGKVTAKISADPRAKDLNFDGKVSMQHLKVADLERLTTATTELKATKGTIDLYAEFNAKHGLITGGVKPVLHDVELAPAKSSPWATLKAWIADLGLDLFSKHENGEQKLATVVPIRGTVNDPKAQLWPTILGVVRNAFVQGVSEGFANVPPPTAGKKQNPVEQLGNALNKSKGPPKAQPTRQGRR